MTDIRITCVVDACAEVGEGPVWDPIEGVLWWTDIRGRRVHRFDPRTGRDDAHEMPIRVGCFALREGGGFVLAAEHGFWFWRSGGGAPEHVLDVEADRPHNRMNDGGCDRQGRLVASSMSTEAPRRPTGACWRLGAELKAERLADGLLIGNGIAFSPAGDRFHLADTGVDRVWVHDYDGATGAVGARRDFVDLTALAGRPDGATIDAEGGYWLAAVEGSRLYRFAPDGALDRTIDLPISKPTRPMFGGPSLEQIYLTSIAVEGEAQSGGLFRIDGLGVRGLPEPRFAG